MRRIVDPIHVKCHKIHLMLTQNVGEPEVLRIHISSISLLETEIFKILTQKKMTLSKWMRVFCCESQV